ncbi:MAG: hypothetical protein K1X55_10090 [Chitinophagales bacterium]|nr:hypothetical protein [Chitinophagales bacterium]
MKNAKTDIYLIECLTNMHVGSGDNNYGDIDNLVQRDPVNNYPCIYSSSLKGAIKEFWNDNEFEEVDEIFGSGSDDNNSNDEQKETEKEHNKSNKGVPGKVKFFQANLLAIPVQGGCAKEESPPYYLATQSSHLEELATFYQYFGVQLSWNKLDLENEIDINYEVKGRKIKEAIAGLTSLYNVHEIDFKEIIEKLPVIARNKLENGESANLWYEEIVPRKTYFVFAVSASENDKALLTTLNSNLHGKVIQIGANASVGYGYCKISNILSHE